MSTLVYIVILVLFFLWMRNSSKKNEARDRAMKDSLRTGMYVMLKDGLYGTIVDIEGDTLVINFSVDGADEGCLSVDRSAVASIVESAASAYQRALEADEDDDEEPDDADPDSMDTAEEGGSADTGADDGEVE